MLKEQANGLEIRWLLLGAGVVCPMSTAGRDHEENRGGSEILSESITAVSC